MCCVCAEARSLEEKYIALVPYTTASCLLVYHMMFLLSVPVGTIIILCFVCLLAHEMHTLYFVNSFVSG